MLLFLSHFEVKLVSLQTQIYMLISSFAFKQNSVTKNLERFWIYSVEENSLIFRGVKTPQETSYSFLDFA